MPHLVLLVDDNPYLLKGLRRAFYKEPFDVITAGDAKSALALLARHKVDLVVSDQEMPGMRGVEFLEQVSRKYPDTVRFMLTGAASLDVAMDAINKGSVSRFFIKPSHEYEMAMSIKEALKHRELIAAARKLYFQLKSQNAQIEKIQQEHPGITVLQKGADGSILLDTDEISQDVIDLIKSGRDETIDELEVAPPRSTNKSR